MVSLYSSLTGDGLSPHSAWRAAFAIVPVPALLFTALLVIMFGTDHPAGTWDNRHRLNQEKGMLSPESSGEHVSITEKDDLETKTGKGRSSSPTPKSPTISSDIDTAVNTPLTLPLLIAILRSPYTWLPTLSYLSTFGFELAFESNLSNILFALYKSPSFGQTKAGYITSAYGLLNIASRPFGGFLSDMVYKRWGVKGKKYVMLGCGMLQGAFAIGLGCYLDREKPECTSVLVRSNIPSKH